MKLSKVYIIVLFFIFAILAGFAIICSSSSDPFHNPEEGLMHLRCYTVIDKDTFNFKNALRIVDSATYFIKGNKVFRKAYEMVPNFQKSVRDSSGKRVDLYLDVSAPQYLIDFDKKLYYSYDPDSALIYEKPIKALESDILFHPRIHNVIKIKLLNVDTTHETYLNHRALYNGTALMLDTKDTVVFKCIRTSLPLKSPLNDWIPGVKYDIISLGVRMKSKIDTVSDGWLMVEICDVERKKVYPSYFLVDTHRIIRK